MTHIEAKASHCVEMPEKQAARNKDWGREYCSMIIQKRRMHLYLVGMFFPSRRQQKYQAGVGPGRKSHLV